MTSFDGFRVLYDALLLCRHLKASVHAQVDIPPVALVAVSSIYDDRGTCVGAMKRAIYLRVTPD